MRVALLFAIALLVACGSDPAPNAGKLTAKNIANIVPQGSAAAGSPGDYYLKNDHATFIIQKPGREAALGPYGGSLIDAALKGRPDHFGELILALALGRTVRIDKITVKDDGSGKGPAVIEAEGVDVTNLYVNLRGLSPELFDSLGLLKYDPDTALNLRVRVRYSLPKNEARLSVTYTFENTSNRLQGVPIGLIADSGGDSEGFVPGTGFDEVIDTGISAESLTRLLTLSPKAPLLVYATPDTSIAVVPRRLGEDTSPSVIGAQLPGFGGALLIGVRSLLDAMQSASLDLQPKAKDSFQVDVLLAPTAHEALARGWELLDEPLDAIEGCVTLTSGGPATHVRVGFMLEDEGPQGFFTTDDTGCFSGRLPPGNYTAIAGGPHRPYSASVATTVPGTVALTLAPLGTLSLDVPTYNALDATNATYHPCRLTLVGPSVSYAHPALGNYADNDPDGVVTQYISTRHCHEELPLTEGRYLAFVTRGPTHSKLETLVEITAGQTTSLTGALHRVVDTQDFVASDLHVHSSHSTDSIVSPEARVLTIAAEGLDFWASTDHDAVVDFSSVISAHDLNDELKTMPGAEVSTFDLGHFGAYPLVPSPKKLNGGAPDWTLTSAGHRPTMRELFDAIHAQGALVQVNHPRAGGSGAGAYFSRANLAYDGTSHAPVFNPAEQLIPNATLRYAEGVSYFSSDFDILEVMNGVSNYLSNGRVFDRGMEAAGKDWMNFLAAGDFKVGVANSDTHSLKDVPGVPRTYIAGKSEGVDGILTELRRGNAVMTSGPFVNALLVTPSHVAHLGQTSPNASEATLHVHVETPDWFQVDTLELVANAFFPEADQAASVAPWFSTPVTPTLVTRPNGGQAYVADLELPIDLESFGAEDTWFVVRVFGQSTGLFPLTRGNGVLQVDAATPETFLHSRTSALPYATTNPIFVDRDGDGVWK